MRPRTVASQGKRRARKSEIVSNEGRTKKWKLSLRTERGCLYVFEIYADKYTGGEIELYTDKNEAV
nr:MAG TPA: hypothetical protein [Caudoviricetes sp.]